VITYCAQILLLFAGRARVRRRVVTLTVHLRALILAARVAGIEHPALPLAVPVLAAGPFAHGVAGEIVGIGAARAASVDAHAAAERRALVVVRGAVAAADLLRAPVAADGHFLAPALARACALGSLAERRALAGAVVLRAPVSLGIAAAATTTPRETLAAGLVFHVVGAVALRLVAALGVALLVAAVVLRLVLGVAVIGLTSHSVLLQERHLVRKRRRATEFGFGRSHEGEGGQERRKIHGRVNGMFREMEWWQVGDAVGFMGGGNLGKEAGARSRSHFPCVPVFVLFGSGLS